MLKQVIITLAITLPALGLCSELPDNYPAGVMHQGTIDGLNWPQRGVVIDDTPFVYTRATRTLKPSGGYASFSDLEIGLRVGCNFSIDDQRRFVLSEVWILPNGVSFPE